MWLPYHDTTSPHDNLAISYPTHAMVLLGGRVTPLFIAAHDHIIVVLPCGNFHTLPTKYPSSRNILTLIYFLDIFTMLKYLASKILYIYLP
jgi:hypothetical protein